MSKFITLVRTTKAKLGEEIVVQGEESRSMFVIHKGLAEVSIIDWDARTVSKAPLPEGESFGELCALPPAKCDEAVEAFLGMLDREQGSRSEMLRRAVRGDRSRSQSRDDASPEKK